RRSPGGPDPLDGGYAPAPRAVSHPDFDRRPWSHTRSTDNWLSSGRGLTRQLPASGSPPVRSFTEARQRVVGTAPVLHARSVPGSRAGSTSQSRRGDRVQRTPVTPGASDQAAGGSAAVSRALRRSMNT